MATRQHLVAGLTATMLNETGVRQEALPGVTINETSVTAVAYIMPATVSMAALDGQSATLTYTAVEGDIVMPVSTGVLAMSGHPAVLDVLRAAPKPMELKFGRKVYLRRW